MQANKNGIHPICRDFIPSLSNEGLCLTRNGLEPNDIFKPTSHLKIFNETFIPANHDWTVQQISMRQSEYHFTFIVDTNRYKNFKSGKHWNDTTSENIKIGIHSPGEVADIRGWYNKIINVSPGYITTIKVKLSQQKSEGPVKDMPLKDRNCRFEDETYDLFSMHNYTKVHCLFDCKMTLAEEICGCRPWDYPNVENNLASQLEMDTRICDFFGNSCFDQILRQDHAPKCDEKCIPDCNQISYSIDISKDFLDPKNRICGIHVNRKMNLESIIRDYIHSLMQRNDDTLIKNKFYANPESFLMNKLKAILSSENDTALEHENLGHYFEKDCRDKLDNDIAVVVVSIDSPTFSRITKSKKATTHDKLAYLGKINCGIFNYKGCLSLHYIKSVRYDIHFFYIGSYMGMLTGITIITLLELAFWIIRFVSQRFSKSDSTKEENSESIPSPTTKRIEALEKRNAAIEKRNAAIEKKNAKRLSAVERKISLGARLRGKVLKPRILPSIKAL